MKATLTMRNWLIPVTLALASAVGPSESAAVPSPPVTRRPTLFVISIGIGEYAALRTGDCAALRPTASSKPAKESNAKESKKEELRNPIFARRDAEAIAARFRAAARERIFERVDVTLLTDGRATRSAVEAALAKLQTARSDDVVVIFFSGHAVKDSTGAGYLLLADSDPDEEHTGIRTADLLTFLENKTPAKRIALLLDNCFSAAIGMVKEAPADVVRLWRRHYELIPGLSTLASSEASESSYSDADCKMSLFTAAVLEGLETKGSTLAADADGDGIVTLRELWQYVRPRVSSKSGGRQTPDLLGAGDVPVVASRPLPDPPSFFRLRLETEPPSAQLFVGDGATFDYVGDSPVFPRVTSGRGVILAMVGGYATETRPVEVNDRDTEVLLRLTSHSGGADDSEIVTFADVRDGESAQAYLHRHGVELSGCSSGIECRITTAAQVGLNTVRPYREGGLFIEESHNRPVSFELRLNRPRTMIRFIRVGLMAGPNGVTHPGWEAVAFDEAGKEVARAEESMIRAWLDVPATCFTLAANGGISSVRFWADGALYNVTADGLRNTRFPFAGFDGIVLDELILGPPLR